MYVLKKLSTKLAAPVEADMEMLRYVGKYLKGTPDLALIHKRSYPGKSFSEMRNRGTDDEDVERDNYKVPALIEVISDSDWAADRESRQSVSCGVIMVNGNLVHFQSKRQKSVEWYRQDPHRLWLVQETHLTPKTIEPFRVQVHKAGLTAYGGLGTMHPLSNRAWGGVAVVAPKHLNCRFIKEFVAEGCGFVLGEILVGSVYLKSGVGLQCSPNPEMLAALAVELKGCRKWVLGGDWNCPAQDFVKMSLESVMHGKICSEGVPTSDSGRTPDFFFLSNDLANLGEPSTSWEVPFRPHAAISLTLRQELLLQPLPSLVGVGKVPPAQWKIGDVDVKCDPASLWLGCFAQQVFKLMRSRNNCRNVNPI